MFSLANAVAGQRSVAITGSWQRHLPVRFREQAMEGRAAYSRWGRERGFPVLYLGRPGDSVTVEAYRHLIDPVEDGGQLLKHLAPRMVVTAKVEVTQILDLRRAQCRADVRLSLDQIQSATSDRQAYAACQEVAAAAHQHGFHGLVAPAATQIGETLALFSNRLPQHEVPVVVSEAIWAEMPDDPRGRRAHLRIVEED